tara:strand:+ start:2156 stop:2680 length:525 start_codon:yes stop_codon:yes gene_type:complete
MERLYWDNASKRVLPYPRWDGGPVEGPIPEDHFVLEVIRELQPEYDPIEEYLVSTTAFDLDTLTYTYDWLVETLSPPGPDYQGFYSALLVSACYQAVLAEVLSATSPAPAGALAVFVSAMQDCLNYRDNPDAMQDAIWLLLGQLHLDMMHVVELQTMLTDARLDQLYSLAPPVT